MEIEVKKKEHKPLLKRTEVVASVSFTGATPTKKEAVAAIAKATGAKQELVIVRKVLTQYGGQSARVLAYVYDDRQSLETLEREAIVKKNTFEKKEKKEGEQ